MPDRNANPVVQSDTAKTPASTVTVGTSTTSLVAANPQRVEITICNDHATQVLYLSLGTAAAVASTGIRVNGAGGSYTTRAYTGAIQAIASGATTVVTITEI